MSEFYNEKLKKKFLETVEGESAREMYEYNLKLAKETEEIAGKDLCNFSLGEIAKVIKVAQPYRLGMAKWKAGIYKGYIQWAIKEELRDDNLNPLDSADEDWYSSLVDWNRKTVISKDELDEIIKQTTNKQDKAAIMMIFEGAWGGSLSELSNLTENDIDWNTGNITLVDEDGNKRDITVSSETLKLLREAHSQESYVYNNGIKKPRGQYERDLIMTEYIFKNIRSKRTENSTQVSKMAIYQRLVVIREALMIPELTPMMIRNSGMLFYANTLLEDNGIMSDEMYDKIGERFGLSKVFSGGKLGYNKSAMNIILDEEYFAQYYDKTVTLKRRKKK